MPEIKSLLFRKNAVREHGKIPLCGYETFSFIKVFKIVNHKKSKILTKLLQKTSTKIDN